MDLRDLKGLHKGLEVDLLLKGPSSCLYQPTNNVTLAVNDYWNHYDVVPVYAVCQDAKAHRMTGYPPPGRFPAMWLLPDDKTYPDAPHRMQVDLAFGFRVDFSFENPIPSGWRITTALAMQLAAGMGASRINLYGLDLGDAYMVDDPEAGEWVRCRHRRFLDAFSDAYEGEVIQHGQFDHTSFVSGTPSV